MPEIQVSPGEALTQLLLFFCVISYSWFPYFFRFRILLLYIVLELTPALFGLSRSDNLHFVLFICRNSTMTQPIIGKPFSRPLCQRPISISRDSPGAFSPSIVIPEDHAVCLWQISRVDPAPLLISYGSFRVVLVLYIFIIFEMVGTSYTYSRPPSCRLPALLPL